MIDGVFRREQEGDHTPVGPGTSEGQDSDINTNTDEWFKSDAGGFKNAQHNDPTLSNIWNRAREGDGDYVVDEGYLYKTNKTNQDGRTEEMQKRLVVPKGYRSKVLDMAHGSIWGGHRGVQATASRITKTFNWPSMTADIQAYVRSCPECQKTAIIKKAERAPLIEVPIIDNPLEVLVYDVMGPITPKVLFRKEIRTHHSGADHTLARVHSSLERYR